MHPLEYAAIIIYILVFIRSFSYGLYAFKQGNSALFGVTLLLLAVSGALFYGYAALTL